MIRLALLLLLASPAFAHEESECQPFDAAPGWPPALHVSTSGRAYVYFGCPVPEEISEACRADITGDGVVGAPDFSLVVPAIGTVDCPKRTEEETP